MVLDGAKRRCGVPTGIRTRVLALKGPRPRPLDDGDARDGATKDTTVDRRQPTVWILFWGGCERRAHSPTPRRLGMAVLTAPLVGVDLQPSSHREAPSITKTPKLDGSDFDLLQQDAYGGDW